MKTYTETKREWTETTVDGTLIYHSPELDRIQRQWGDVLYRQREKEEAVVRESQAWIGDYVGYGNGILGYTPEFVSH